MDHRKRLRIPENFAYVMRSAGANFRGLEFQISFAVAVGGVRAIALIGHNQCGMVDLGARRSEFIHGLIDRAGWSRSRAERHFDGLMPQFEIGDAAELVHSQARDLQQQYPPLVVAPLMYDVEDGMLYQLDEPAEGNR
jgi:carbonic anhydrase